MADVLTHVLVGFLIGTLLSVRYDWLGPEFVTLVMIGALSPDFVKIDMVIPGETVAALLGIPFSWSPLHVLAGTVIVVLLGSLLVAPEYRTRAIALFFVGAVSHHVLDLLLISTTGYSYAVFWPVTEVRFPRGDLYLSSDRGPVMVVGALAVVVWYGRERLDSMGRNPPAGTEE